MPAGMELFPASDLSQWELIKAVIIDSDYYIVIIGGRYGSIHRGTGLSFTEMEYDFAVSQGLPILGFVRKDISNIQSRFCESDPIARAKLESFREKVLSRICRQFENPTELGMHVMKSLMSETRTNPRVGWVKADQARGREDLEREQALIEEIKEKTNIIGKLEREMRDRIVPLEGFAQSDLAQGSDLYPLSVTYQNQKNQHVSDIIDISWDELFSVIAPTMFGYIMRCGPASHNRLVGQYSFEGAIVEYIRTKIIERCGRRKVDVLPHQIDEILIQFKQLGLLGTDEHTEVDGGRDFRGYSLTVAGEEYLTRLKIRRRSA